MNRIGASSVGGDILAVSQFTLYASTRKGNRPSWSARPRRPRSREPAFDAFVAALSQRARQAGATGVFGAHMAGARSSTTGR